MKDKLKLYAAAFDPMWPVPSGLIILARSKAEALKIAEQTVIHTDVLGVELIHMNKAKVIYYESGDY